MSLCKNGSVRCDVCGKLSRGKLGEYTRKDGLPGTIWSVESAGFTNLPASNDVCDDCIEAREAK